VSASRRHLSRASQAFIHTTSGGERGAGWLYYTCRYTHTHTHIGAEMRGTGMEIMATQTGNVTVPSRLTQVFFSTPLPRK